MAENETPEPNAEEQPKKKLPIKAMLVLAGILLLEGAVITAVFMFSGGPADVRANTAAETLAAQAERPVEIEVVSERFQNVKTGRTYLYETEVVIVVQRKHQGKVEEKLEEMQKQIHAEIAYIFRRAEPAHLLEPTLSTLTRQINAKLDELLGPAEEDGKSMLQKTVISKCTQFRADF